MQSLEFPGSFLYTLETSQILHSGETKLEKSITKANSALYREAPKITHDTVNIAIEPSDLVSRFCKIS